MFLNCIGIEFVDIRIGSNFNLGWHRLKWQEMEVEMVEMLEHSRENERRNTEKNEDEKQQ